METKVGFQNQSSFLPLEKLLETSFLTIYYLMKNEYSDLATKCHLNGAPFEWRGFVGRLLKMRS